MEFRLEQVKNQEQDILKNLLEFYLYDFNFYYEDDLNKNGRFDFIDIKPYFENSNNTPYFIKVNDNYAGFVLLAKTNDVNTIEEFWIMPKYRKGYFAFSVLKEIINLCNGKIEFIILNQNERWLKTIKYLVHKNFKMIKTEKYIKWEVVEFTKFQMEKI